MSEWNRNFLTETLEVMASHYKQESDIQWIGSKDGMYSITWQQFCSIADFEYYAGYGSAEIAEDLVIVGSNWWLERGEYDGAEWWEFKSIPVIGDKTQLIKTVKSSGCLFDVN